MSLSQRLTGKNLYVGFMTTSGTVSSTVDLTGDRRSLQITYETELEDMTAGNDTARGHVATIMNHEASLTLLYKGTAGTADLALVAPKSVGTLVYGPNGTAAGQPKGGFPAVVQRQNMNIPYPNAIEVTIDFMPQGDLAFDPNSATW